MIAESNGQLECCFEGSILRTECLLCSFIRVFHHCRLETWCCSANQARPESSGLSDSSGARIKQCFLAYLCDHCAFIEVERPGIHRYISIAWFSQLPTCRIISAYADPVANSYLADGAPRVFPYHDAIGPTLNVRGMAKDLKNDRRLWFAFDGLKPRHIIGVWPTV